MTRITLRMTFDVLIECASIGRDAAQGRDALPKLAVQVTRAVTEGIVTLDANKHGDGIDDAKFIYGEYIASDSKKAIHDHTADGLKAQVSKLRADHQVRGEVDKYDAVDVLDRASGSARRCRPATRRASRPLTLPFVDVAREQVANDDPLSDDELGALVAKTVERDRRPSRRNWSRSPRSWRS
jgi:hypothetical protein